MLELVLEPLDAQHLAAVQELVRDPDVLRFTRVPEPAPPEFPRQWLAMYEEGRKDGTFDGSPRGSGHAQAPELGAHSRAQAVAFAYRDHLAEAAA